MRIVLRGGEELARLKFEDGDISMLAIAASCYWPELEVADVTRLYGQRNLGRALHDDVGRAILELTGGEPRMVGHCVRRLGELDEADVPVDAAGLQTMADDLLADCELGHQLFTPLRRDADARLGCASTSPRMTSDRSRARISTTRCCAAYSGEMPCASAIAAPSAPSPGARTIFVD